MLPIIIPNLVIVNATIPYIAINNNDNKPVNIIPFNKSIINFIKDLK